MMIGIFGQPPLTPAQWLPKPTTNKVPSIRPALRAPWSRPRGEGEESRRTNLSIVIGNWYDYQMVFMGQACTSFALAIPSSARICRIELAVSGEISLVTQTVSLAKTSSKE